MPEGRSAGYEGRGIMAAVLLTGGTGYIGSHTAVELINEGYQVVIADDLSNSEESVIDRIEKITGTRPAMYVADVTDRAAVESIFDENDIDGVIHFAGFKAVGESVGLPLKYYRNNIDTAITVLEEMKRHGCRKIIFSSSATVYTAFDGIPYEEETSQLGCTNPYGWTKYMVERIIRDCCSARPEMSAVLLRYFNPVGAHPSGLLGEKPCGIPNNLMPYITQVAAGIREKLFVYGSDYDTPDGTGVRDYLHVVDLARGHVAAYRFISENTGCETFNLGTGRGTSVLEMIRAFEEATGITIPYEFVPRREGDAAAYYAVTDKAERVLGWKAGKSLKDMCTDAWNWQKGLWSD